ncbi:hypothetical protein JDV02_010680 [Purpureocillium takamizusanense]|uniref:N-acetyltransferase domain-containing protein n=1 Tax=Purpureocillium takamizusanense TaxID=2060973 RepID=A0A9Q8QUY4_9HYPO|nr:uncharacterized protein JDV02_010680 [Purpureocillium takamizusanense]UNI24967.1 hypothetical protein JDV02_010680 [Purpureocillium takamizusanense]
MKDLQQINACQMLAMRLVNLNERRSSPFFIHPPAPPSPPSSPHHPQPHSMPVVKTRLTGPSDAAAVAALLFGLLDELWSGNGPDVESLTRTAASVLGDPTVTAALAYVVEDDDGDDNNDDEQQQQKQQKQRHQEPVGVVTINECTAIYAGGKFGEVSELYVCPRMRSRGVAPHLIDVAVELARRRGWKRLEVCAPSQPRWSRSLSFYKRNGFRELGPRLCRDV